MSNSQPQCQLLMLYNKLGHEPRGQNPNLRHICLNTGRISHAVILHKSWKVILWVLRSSRKDRARVPGWYVGENSNPQLGRPESPCVPSNFTESSSNRVALCVGYTADANDTSALSQRPDLEMIPL